MQIRRRRAVRSCVLLCCLVLGASLAAIGQSEQTSTPAPAVAPTAQPSSGEGFAIGQGDLLDITAYGVDDMKQTVRVDSNGDISLPLLGNVPVEGLTALGAEKALDRVAMDKHILNRPQFSVFIKESATGGITVTGEVQKPGIFPPQSVHRLMDAIAIAGGVTGKAGRVVKITHRSDPDNPTEVRLPQDSDDPMANVQVEPGDTVLVTKAGLVYVVGEVQRPSGLVMENNDHMTVLQAISMAQGVTHFAKLSQARIIRRNTDGTYLQIPVKLNDIFKAKSPDVALKKDDILFVPTAATKAAMQRGAESAVEIAVGTAIYRF